MANIKVNDIVPAGFELFADSESFLNDLNENDVNYIKGGGFTLVCTFAHSCAGAVAELEAVA
ncbi:MAG: hypothetical protein V7K89_16945 [Nostoc sp.]|uniref:hypothetical protein n=1 Tax=Nostoc sp. TaxID=1180 RepID=UPI002FF7C271